MSHRTGFLTLPDRDEDGFALVLVMGFMVVLSLISVTVFAIATRTLNSSGSHDRFEQALTASENGIDQIVARLQKVYSDTGVDSYATPALASASDPTPDCPYAAITSPSFATPAAEQSWAKSQLLGLASAHPSCVRRGADGDYIVIKPANTIAVPPAASVYRQVVYSLGWAPSRSSANSKTRLVKSEYLFAPYRPSNAVLTGGNLEIDASTKVTTASGFDPTLASVHTNGVLTVPNGNPIVTGQVSSTSVSTATSNKFLGGNVATTPQQGLPFYTAATVWRQLAQKAGASWHDLCSDGYIHSPPAVGAAGAAPCSGPVLTMSPGTLGWTFTPATGTAVATAARWTASGLDNNSNGTWYANGANIVAAGGSSAMALGTMIASAVNPSVCQKVGGLISWDHIDIAAPSVPNLFMLADADLVTDSNWKAGDVASNTAGLFVAGDQINMQTSSAGLVGAVVAEDQCAPPSGERADNLHAGPIDVVKNPTVYFDPDAEAPFTDIIRTTLWLELTN